MRIKVWGINTFTSFSWKASFGLRVRTNFENDLKLRKKENNGIKDKMCSIMFDLNSKVP